MAKSPIYVKIIGTGINEVFKALSHEIKGLPGGTYHVFEMESGATVFFNDFGIRSVTIGNSLEAIK